MSDKKLKLGSLFDGVGGFPLVGSWYGIEPVWASEIEPAPIRITSKKFPNMKHLGDITQINGGEIEPVDILTGGSPCFPAGTLILTEKGYRPIETIKVGDIVLTHMGRWRKVTAVGSREAETILLKGNFTLETTQNHPIYSADIVYTYKKNEKGKRPAKKNLINVGQWRNASEMKGHQWATVRTMDAVEVPEPQKYNIGQNSMPAKNEAFWYFFGRWLGDGLGHETNIICDSKDKVNELAKTVEKLGLNYSITYARPVVKVRLTLQRLCEWLVTIFGKGAINKEIPPFVMGLSEEYRSSLLQGILDSDGFKIRENKYKISSISKTLILGIRMLAESLGYTTSIIYTKRPETCVIEGRVVNQHDTWTIGIVKNPNRMTGMRDELHTWYKCRNVIPTNQTKTVYNISVEDDESYVADSIVVHNCTSLSVAGKQEGISKKCPYCHNVIGMLEGKNLTTCPKCGEELGFTESGLFMEQMRIIKEMRDKTNGKFPKIVWWENVAGAFSSNNGDDFYCVLKEFCKLAGERLPETRPKKWTKCGEILGDTFSIAWRLFDAQYWGVPQRRKRVYLVMDFTGHGAREILFKPEGMRRHFKSSKAPWERTASETKECT